MVYNKTMRTKLTKKDVKDILSITFPDYRGRKFWLDASGKVWLHDTNAAGGTINEFKAVSGGKVRGFSPAAPWNNVIEGKQVEIPVGVCVVEYSVFCGVETGITFYINPADAPLLFPKENT